MKEILEDCFVINPEFYGLMFCILIFVSYCIYLIERKRENGKNI